MKYLPILKKYGVSFTHIGRLMGMRENLIRYHVTKEPLDPDFERKFIETINKNSEKFLKIINKKPK